MSRCRLPIFHVSQPGPELKRGPPNQLTGRCENWGLTKEPFSQKNARVNLTRRRELFAPNRTRR
jgi:hypothetical protein